MKKLEHYSDLKLIIGKGDNKKEYAVHKMILMGHSPKFEPTKESQIELPDADPASFEQILEYLYTEKFPPTSNLLATAKLYVAANKMQMTGLRLEAVND